jgi:hypothetical protein
MRVRLSSMIGALAVAAALGCSKSDEPVGHEPTSTRTSAITQAAPPAAPPNQADMLRPSDIGPAPGLAPAQFQQIPRPVDIPASQQPAHASNKVVNKPLPAPGADVPLAPVPAAVIAKQNEYLRQRAQLDPTIATLPAAEQEARRAVLKRQVMGE